MQIKLPDLTHLLHDDILFQVTGNQNRFEAKQWKFLFSPYILETVFTKEDLLD